MCGWPLAYVFICIVGSICAALNVAALLAVLRPMLAPVLTALLAGCGAVAALSYLVMGAPAVTLDLPIGLPGAGITLALDGLSAVFLLVVFLASTAAAASAIGDHHYTETAPFLPAFVGGMALALVAGDGFSLLLGFEAMSVTSLVLVLSTHRDGTVRQGGLLYGGMAALGALSLIMVVGLLAQRGLSFAAMRAAPPEGWRAILVLALVLVGAGSKAGIVPLHTWLPPAHAAAPAHVSALMSGVMTKVALYVVVRVLFDLCGPAQPAWFGVPLIVLGAAGALLGALRANMEGDIKAALACSTIENVGLITIGFGVALVARGADLPALASLGAAAALLHIVAHGLFKPLLFLGAGAIQDGAGTRRLDRLGGLIHRMPVTSALLIFGAVNLAALPPTAGFAGEWLLFQSVLGAPRIGGFAVQVLVCVTAGLMAMGAALAAAAAVRLVGVALLGRPRGPRAAAAEEAGPWKLRAMSGVASVAFLVGLFPGSVLRLAGPALRTLTGAEMGERAGLAVLTPALDMPGYAALLTLALLLLAFGAIWFLRQFADLRTTRGPAWDCGFGASTARLPFGDPLTQYSGGGFSQPLRRALGHSILAAREVVSMPEPGDTSAARIEVTLRDPANAWVFAPFAYWRDKASGIADTMQFLTIRQILSVMVGVLVLFLIVIAVIEQL